MTITENIRAIVERAERERLEKLREIELERVFLRVRIRGYDADREKLASLDAEFAHLESQTGADIVREAVGACLGAGGPAWGAGGLPGALGPCLGAGGLPWRWGPAWALGACLGAGGLPGRWGGLPGRWGGLPGALGACLGRWGLRRRASRARIASTARSAELAYLPTRMDARAHEDLQESGAGMRLAKGKQITFSDVAEIEKFREFLRDVKSGATKQEAYALHYGETIFDAGATQKASEQP